MGACTAGDAKVSGSHSKPLDLQELQSHGKLVNSGAFAEPFDGGIQIFEDCTRGDVEAYLSRDPCTQ